MAVYTRFDVVNGPTNYWWETITATLQSATATELVFSNTDGTRTIVTGNGFFITPELAVTGGYITGITRVRGVNPPVELERTQFPFNEVVEASRFFLLVFSNNDAGLLDLIYATNDIVTGNSLDDNFVGGTGNDSISGNGGNDTLIGLDGRDSLIGGFGDDFLGGNMGNDRLFGQEGNDAMFGDEGNDTMEAETVPTS